MMLNDLFFSRIIILSMHQNMLRIISEEKNIEVLEWPSQLPDLDPIEHTWSYMKRQLQSFHAENKEELKLKIVEIWDQITLDFCK